VGRICGTRGARCLQGFGWEDLGIGERITVSWILGRRDRWGELDSVGSR
jgi:hypothetical protein